MQGTAQSNERISEMLRNLTDGSPWFSKPELMEIVAKTVDVTAKDKRRAAAFTLRFNLTRASDAEIAGFVRAVGHIAREAGLVTPGYRLLANAGPHSHQEVPHLHVHILAGRPLGPMLVQNDSHK
jgi:hypothetical protein